MSSDFYAKRLNMPIEISDFLFDTFLIIEQRSIISKENGIKFEVRIKENNHKLPHIHVYYAEYQISIAIETGNILARNLPKQQMKHAVKWVLKHKQKLLNEWSSIHIDTTLPMTSTRLDILEKI